MRKTIGLFLLITTVTFLAQGQARVTVGTPYKVVDAPIKDYFIQGDDILTVKVQNRRITIQKLDARDLSLVKVQVFEDLVGDWVLENIKDINGRLFFFYSLWDSKNENEQLFAREIDFKQGTFMGPGRKIVTVKGKVSGTLVSTGFYSFRVEGKFDFQYSFNKSKILVQYRLKPKVKNDAKSYDVIGMSIFDKDLLLLWDKEVVMPYTEKKMNNLDYSIDSEGNTYILTSVYDDNTTDIKKSKDGPANYHIELLRISYGSNQIESTPISIENKFINKLGLFESPQSYMIGAGYYNKGKDLSDVDGILLFKVGKEDGRVYDYKSFEIPVDILNQYETVSSQKKNAKKDADGKAEFQELELRQLVVSEDGSLLLIGEQHYIITTTYYTGRTYYTRTIYYYNDILVTKIDSEGRLAWMRKLPKRQQGGGGKGGMSFKYIHENNDNFFLFLDNLKNMNLELNKVPAYHIDGAGGYLTAYKISDENGSVNKLSLLDTKNVNGMPIYQFNTNRILPVSAEEFVFEAYKKKKQDVLIKVSFER